MLSNLTGWHFVIILFVVLLLFGAPKLPALARSLGQSAKILKTELKPGDDTPTTPAASTGVTQATPETPAATPGTTPAPPNTTPTQTGTPPA